MRKLFLIILSVFCLYSISFCADVPPVAGLGSIKTDDLPPGATPPTTIFKTDNISGPLPTNKWFTSILFGCYDSDFTNINKNSFKMYTYPQVIKCDDEKINGLSYGLLIEAPNVIFSDKVDYEINYGTSKYGEKLVDDYPNVLKITPYKTIEYNTINPINTTVNGTKLTGYSDWAATAIWIDDYDNTKWMKATFGQGFLFTYFEFSKNIYPAIEFPYNWDEIGYGENCRYILYDTKNGNKIDDNAFKKDYIYENDSLLLQIKLPNKDRFYGIFVPKGTQFFQVEDTAYDKEGKMTRPWIKISIKFPDTLPEEKRFISTALLPSSSSETAKKDIIKYYKYAYNFVSTTTVKLDIITKNNLNYATTDFKFTFNKKREKEEGIIFKEVEGLKETVYFNNYSDQTFFCLFPHQYKATTSNATKKLSNNELSTLRGNLKIYEGSSFSTENKVCGVIPFFKLTDFSKNAKEKIITSLKTDKDIDIDMVKEENTYFYGKNVAKIANLIPVSDNIYNVSNDTTTKLIKKLKDELINWFTYNPTEESKYFAFDKTWGGIIGIMNGFGSQNYNDHNFHYGYFIYASAILAMYDETFEKDYGGIVKLLIEDIANTDRENKSFPYMRSFDFYEGHSWANGLGGSDDNGIDIESSSEAMNAWAAIYMWGLATKNDDYIKLGLYLYTIEYQAIKSYFFVTGKDSVVKDIFNSAGYKENSVGILYGGTSKYKVHWGATDPRQIRGIQVLPMTSSLLYTGYDSYYAKNKFFTTSSYTWNDIWTRFQALYAPNEAWINFDENHEGTDYIDDGGTATYTYHFIDFFRQNGTLETGYSASMPSYLVTIKNDIPVFSAYNYTNNIKNVTFYDSTGNDLGYMTVPAKTFKTTTHLKKDSEDETLLIYPVPYKPSNSNYGGQGIHFENISDGSDIKIFNIAGELVYEKTIANANKDFIWNVRNNSGNKIASGIYIYYIITPDGKKHKGKLAIER